MQNLKFFKHIYDRLENDKIRSFLLTLMEWLGIRKNIIRMDTNNFCNIKCIMCNRESSQIQKHFMPLEQFKLLMDILGTDTRILYLSCACEPLATPNFIEYLSYAKQKKIPHISFCTNALLLKENITSFLIKESIEEIIVSFNGFTKDDYERIMVGSNYELICKNLKTLAKTKSERKSTRPYVRLNVILLKTNILNAEKIIDFVREYNIHTVQFRELMQFENQNDLNELKKEDISNLSPKELVTYQKKIHWLAARLQKMGTEVILPAMYSTAPSNTNNKIPVTKAKETKSCSVPFFSYWIDWEGNTRICGYDQKGVIGNVFMHTKKELKKQRNEFRKLALMGECSSELCTMNIDTSLIK